MPAENILFPRPCYEGMISTSLEVIWEISAKVKSGCRLQKRKGNDAQPTDRMGGVLFYGASGSSDQYIER